MAGASSRSELSAGSKEFLIWMDLGSGGLSFARHPDHGFGPVLSQPDVEPPEDPANRPHAPRTDHWEEQQPARPPGDHDPRERGRHTRAHPIRHCGRPWSQSTRPATSNASPTPIRLTASAAMWL